MNDLKNKKIVFSCFLASTLEIYDFVIFGFLSKAIHDNYLSFLDKDTSLFVTFMFFAIGFIFRPVGSIIFGHIGDKVGRKKALVTSISMMGICSLIMFALPSYSHIGIFACFIIVFVRIIQGISVGGEFTGAIVFTMEHMDIKNRGFAVGVLSAGGACGVLLASFVSKLLQLPIIPEYGWRFAFLLGFSLAVVSYFIRTKLNDTDIFIKVKKNTSKVPLFSGLKTHKLECISTIFVAAANGTCFYFGAVFLPNHLSAVRGDGNYGYISLVIAFTMFTLLPIFGKLSDRFNRKTYLLICSCLMSIVGLFSIKLITFAEEDILIILYSIFYTVFAAMMIGAINIYAAEIFPPEIRMSNMSFFYSIGMGVIGGTVAMVASYIVRNNENPEYLLGGYIASICLLAALSVILVRFKNRRISQDVTEKLT